MPSTAQQAIEFLETQWSSVNANKIVGIEAELRFKALLASHSIHFRPGGWIVTPGNTTLVSPATREKICLLPRSHAFSWQPGTLATTALTPAEISAYICFRQVGARALFVSPSSVRESYFELPQPRTRKSRATYPRAYPLELAEVGTNGALTAVAPDDAFKYFPLRKGNKGLRCYDTGRLTLSAPPWTDFETLSSLFWFEYARYYFQIDYLFSNNDLDLFIVGPSGRPYPVELKSKAVASDTAMGKWFGIDIGPFAKLAFFTANSQHNDALYVVEEVDAHRNHVDWWGITFTELVKACSWVGQRGGKGMSGGASSTYKVPMSAFTPLISLLPTL